jgi:hypothetical protein
MSRFVFFTLYIYFKLTMPSTRSGLNYGTAAATAATATAATATAKRPSGIHPKKSILQKGPFISNYFNKPCSYNPFASVPMESSSSPSSLIMLTDAAANRDKFSNWHHPVALLTNGARAPPIDTLMPAPVKSSELWLPILSRMLVFHQYNCEFRPQNKELSLLITIATHIIYNTPYVLAHAKEADDEGITDPTQETVHRLIDVIQHCLSIDEDVGFAGKDLQTVSFRNFAVFWFGQAMPNLLKLCYVAHKMQK